MISSKDLQLANTRVVIFQLMKKIIAVSQSLTSDGYLKANASLTLSKMHITNQ